MSNAVTAPTWKQQQRELSQRRRQGIVITPEKFKGSQTVTIRSAKYRRLTGGQLVKL